MGTVAAGLGSIGGGLEQARELKRKEEFERAKLGIEQGQLGVSQQYAAQHQQAQALEQQRERRLAEEQAYRMRQSPGDPALQAKRDRDYLTSLLGHEPSQETLERWAKIAPPVKVGALKQVQDPTSPTGWSWQAVDESTNIPVITQKGAPPPASGMESVRTTTGTKQMWVDDPDHPGKQKMVNLPTSSTSVTRKVPAPAGSPTAAASAASKAKPSSTMAPTATLTKTNAGTANKIYTGFQKWQDAKTNVDTMQQDETKANAVEAKGDPKSSGAFDMDLLSRHIAMTFGAVKGIRGGQYLIEHHIKARSLPDSLVVMYEKLKNGSQLSPEQRKNFVERGKSRVDEFSREYNDTRALAGYAPDTRVGGPSNDNPLGLEIK